MGKSIAKASVIGGKALHEPTYAYTRAFVAVVGFDGLTYQIDAEAYAAINAVADSFNNEAERAAVEAQLKYDAVLAARAKRKNPERTETDIAEDRALAEQAALAQANIAERRDKELNAQWKHWAAICAERDAAAATALSESTEAQRINAEKRTVELAAELAAKRAAVAAKWPGLEDILFPPTK